MDVLANEAGKRTKLMEEYYKKKLGLYEREVIAMEEMVKLKMESLAYKKLKK